MVTGLAGSSTVNYIGQITSNTGFTSVTPLSIESSDSVSIQGNEIAFDIRTAHPWQDQFAFTADDDANLCLTLSTSPAGSQTFVGPNREAPVAASFDPRTGSACL